MRKMIFSSLAASFLVVSPATAANLVFSGVSPTSDDYALGVVWSGLARNDGINMTVVENGTVAGMRKAAQGEVDLVGIGAPHYLDAVDGTGNYEQDPDRLREAYRDMKVIVALPTGMAQYVVPADSDVDEFRDLAGKSVGIGRPGGNAGAISQILFDVHEIGGEVNGQHLEYGPALEQMASGTLDATLVWGSVPTAAIDNASRGMRLRFVSPDAETLDEFREAVTNGEYYRYQEVSAETIEAVYDGRVEAGGDTVRFWTFPYQIMVRGDVDEETVYRLTQALWENIESVHQASAALSLITADSALEGVSGEVHPGARRYYEEAGIL